jgi:trans-aconitate methyltransferase
MASPNEDIGALYERHALEYARDRGPDIAMERRWLDRFLSLVPAGNRVLDLGCGQGEPIARYIVASGRRVHGIDTSPTLIALARAKLPGETWEVADMRGLALGRAYEGLIAWDSFFHLTRDHQRAMFPVFARHAAPGAALLFTSGPADGEAMGHYRGDVLYHASLAPNEYRSLLAAQGFEVIAHLAEDPDCGRHTVWLARRAVASTR